MSTKADYNALEWETLRDTPVFTALAMSTASPNGLVGAAQEAAAVAQSIDKAAQHSNPLIAELNQKDEGGQQALHAYMQDTAGQKKGDDLRDFLKDNALMMCRMAARILANHASGDESDLYKSWVLRQATAVAQAAKENGQVVSLEEAMFLGEIGKALTAEAAG